MEEEKKLHEEKRMEGRGSFEDEEDYKATLWYDLEKEMKQIFEQFFKEPKPSTSIYDYARELTALGIKYEKAGLSWEEISEIRKDIVNGKR